MDEIHEVTGMKLAELRDVTAERKHWRRMVKTVARTRRVDSTRNQGNLRFTVLLLHILGDTIVQLMTPSKVTADAPHRKIRYVIKRPDPPSLGLLRYFIEMHLPPYTARHWSAFGDSCLMSAAAWTKMVTAAHQKQSKQQEADCS